MVVNLTRGAVAMIMDGARNYEDGDIKPVLQVYHVRSISYGRSNTVRYRLTLSDGSQLQEATIPTHMNGIVRSCRLCRGSIIRLTEFVCSSIQKRKLIAVIDLEIIAETSDIIPVVVRDNNANFGTVTVVEHERIPGQSPPANAQAIASGNLQSLSYSFDGFFPRQTVIRRYPQSRDHLQVMKDADAANVATEPKPHVDNAVNEPIDLNGSGSAPVLPTRSDQTVKVGGPSANDVTAGLICLSSGVVPLLENENRSEKPILQVIDPFDSITKNCRMFISDGSHMRLAFIHPHSLIFIKPAKLQNGTIFRLVSYNFTSIAKQKMIILSTVEIVANNHDIIGEPKLYLTAVEDDFTTTVFGSGPLGPRPSSPTADFQEYLDASCGNDQYSPFQLHRIPTTENLPSSSSKSTKHKISKPHDQFHAQIHLPSYPNSAVQSQFSKPYQPQQSQSCKELLNEMYGLPYYVPPPLSALPASPYFPPQHDDCWRVEADVLKGRLLQLDLEMKREKDNHQAEVACLKADMEDYQNQINTLGKELEAARKKADAIPKVRVMKPNSSYSLF